MRSSSAGAKQAAGVSSRLSTLHQRLYNALKLGQFIRCNDSRRQKWQCTDIGTQKLVIRSIDAFVDCVSSETVFQHPLVKDSMNDIAGALESILEFRSESVLILAADTTAKFVRVLPSSLLESHVNYLIDSLLSLICTRQLQVSIICVTALNSILSSLTTRREREVWEVLKRRDSVVIVLNNMKDYITEESETEHCREMARLLSQILWRWPHSRFSAWSDSKFLDILDKLRLKQERSLKAAVLRVYSGLALCSNGAKKLLTSGKSLVEVMVDSMNCSDSHSVRMEGFRLAQCLMVSEQQFVEVMKLCCGLIVSAIVNGMKIKCLHPEKLTKDQISLVEEACRLALITRWGGNHHSYFWIERVDAVLLSLLLMNFGKTYESLHQIPLQEQIIMLQDCFSENSLSLLRPYIWDILGGLAANVSEDFFPSTREMASKLKVLIACACLAFMDSISKACQISPTISSTVWGEPASRAVLLMVYSPGKYIASEARLILSEVLRLNGKEHIDNLLRILNATSYKNTYLVPSNFQVAISLTSLACYACLTTYEKQLLEHKRLQTLLIFLRRRFSNPTHIKRSNLAPHLNNSFSERLCCHQVKGDWEGDDMLVLFGLWCLGQLIHSAASRGELSELKLVLDESQMCKELENICSNHSSSGSRWHAAYILSHFGIYGFPSSLGKKVGKAFMDDELADLELITGLDSIHVHEVILSVMCPQLLPQRDKLLKETEVNGRSITQVRLSSHVDHQSLVMLMEYVYLGCIRANEDSLKRLKILAKHCRLQSLFCLLSRKRPKWGSPVPTFDLTSALGPAGYHSSDVVLEAETRLLEQWSCSFCLQSVPHFHVHRVILASSCDYLQALFRSGMQESNLQTIKLPVNWGSLTRLVPWLYSNELPKPVFDCAWNNLRVDEKLDEMRSYVELCWLAEFWLLDDLHEQCFEVVVSGLNNDRCISIELIQLAAKFDQWKLAEIAAECMAPLYNQLRSNGDLDQLNEDLVNMVRTASVQLSKLSINDSR